MTNSYVNENNDLSTQYAMMMWSEEIRTFTFDEEFDAVAHDLMHYFCGEGQ